MNFKRQLIDIGYDVNYNLCKESNNVEMGKIADSDSQFIKRFKI